MNNEKVKVMKFDRESEDPQEIGTFEVRSGKIIISDPCYEFEEKIAALNGKWVAIAVAGNSGFGGRRIGRMVVCHESMAKKISGLLRNSVFANTIKIRICHGVDSGQMSVFDASEYGEDRYDDCCAASRPAGIVDNCGVVVSAGDGDGGYGGYLWKNDDNLAVAMNMRFL